PSHTNPATSPPEHGNPAPVVLGELALEQSGGVRLEHVALLDVSEVPEHDAALVACADLADVVLEASQAGHLAVVDDRAVAHQPHLGTTGDLAFDHVGAGDRAHARGAEH